MNNTESEDTQNEELNTDDILQIISNAARMESINRQQVRAMRAELGIFNSHFTKKHVTNEKRKAKQKAQKAARAATRKKGYKGQKLSSGRYKK